MIKNFLLLIIPCLVWSQELSFIEKTPLNADIFLGLDTFNNTYYISNQVLYKKSESNLFNFNEFQLGKINSVDIINPLNVVVFYADFNTVIFLDNNLNEIERIYFNMLSEFKNISTATLAGNNNLWVFNINTQQLELFNYRSLRESVVSQPFPGKLLSQSSNFNYCFVLTENKLRSFNIYGSLIFEKDSNGFEKIVQQNENIIAIKENELFFISENSIKPKKIPLPEINIKDLQLTQDFLYIYDGNYIHTFNLTKPN